eukprot:1202549-Pyramimonas_sp.AAC.1
MFLQIYIAARAASDKRLTLRQVEEGPVALAANIAGALARELATLEEATGHLRPYLKVPRGFLKGSKLSRK